MHKRKIIIYTMISTIISVLFILGSYYGFNRYIALHVKSPTHLIKSYSQLPKALDKRVIVSFTTTPREIHNIKPMILSILDQTVKVDQIVLVIPNNMKKKYRIPQYLNDIVTIAPCAKDYGCGTPIIPNLLREKEKDTIIIVLKDNKVYGKDFIEMLVEESEIAPDHALVDSNNNVVLLKPSHYGCDVLDREKDQFCNGWFISHAKKTKMVDYSENYKML